VSTTRWLPAPESSTPLRICVVGSGWHFTSGISYYTCRLVGALDGKHEVSAILLRRLIPRWLYPGRARVGTTLHRLTYPKNVPVFDGIDWFWGPSLWRAMRFLRRERPEVLVLQWWTGAVLHTYWALTHLARRLGITVIVEFHETQDSGEASLPFAGRYLRMLGRRVLAKTDAVLVHSEFDGRQIRESFAIGAKPVGIAPHGPYDHHVLAIASPRATEHDVTRLLFFGTIRPYKGLEHLVAAFDLLTDEQARGFRLTIIGETWEGWRHPLEQARLSRHKDRITIVNRYVDDDEVTTHFGVADVVVLPYIRSSSSGPLHIAMSHGLPVVLTDVGGLRDAASGYGGIVWTPAGQPEALRDALLAASGLCTRRYDDPRSWDDTVTAFEALVAALSPGHVGSY
jgi:glycosyltransferase involved in cell wall biosynthesis